MNPSQITKLASTAARAAAPAAKLRKATQEIEAIFVKDLIAAMRKTAKHQALGDSLGGEMYQDMFDQAMSDGASKSGTLGIAKTIFRQMAPQAIRAALRTENILPSHAHRPTPPAAAPFVGNVEPNARPNSFESNLGQDALAIRGLKVRSTTKP